MKNAKLNIKKFTIVLTCILVVLAMIFTLVACSHKDTNPSNFPSPDNIDSGDVTPDDNPSGDTTPDDNQSGDNPSGNTTPDDNQSSGTTPDQPTPDADLKELEEFFASLNLSDKNALTTITVSFGGRMLAKKEIEYVRAQNGGTIVVTTTTLAEANAKDPYKTERLDTQTLGEAEFESKFPYADALDAETVKALEYSLSTSQHTLMFELTAQMLKSLLSLDDAETNNIATSITVTVKNADETSFIATYKSANGNDVQIKIIYQ
ncbi:MAG: hypothetical protein J5713_00185 [Clostridia bacterium]|nr:hypothetical protein [Clostridia bacterium]